MKRLAKVARLIVWCTGLAFRTAPVSMTVTVIIRILVAFIPSAQVLLVNQLTRL